MFRRSIDQVTVQQRGVILVIVLWFVSIITILVAVLASEVRLSSKVVFTNKTGTNIWSDTLTALNMAKMELLMRSMPDPPTRKGEKEVPLEERRNKAFRFNGQILTFAYPVPKTVTVRIYDHAGKIPLNRLAMPQIRELLEHRVGSEDREQFDSLLEAWQDWTDPNDLKGLKGAEKEFYKKLIPPYEPRNYQLEFVDELLLIKGFEKIFKDINLDAAFTMYGSSPTVNINLATKEALMLLPGFDEGKINAIFNLRQEKDLKFFQDLNEIMPPEQLTGQVQKWLNFSSISNVFTVAVLPKNPAEKQQDENTPSEALQTKTSYEKQNTEKEGTTHTGTTSSQKQFAYMATVELPSNSRRAPEIRMVQPYGWLPDMSYENLPPPKK